MSRASFGGAQDYSGLFASVFGNDKAAADQAAYDAKNAAIEAKNKQTAADQDAADMWSQGAMSNADWLAYIATRVANTTDPVEHEKWIKYQRKYTQDIAINTAEFNFQNGGSINEVIAFYQTLVANKEADSTSTEKNILRLNALMDQRTSEVVSKGVQEIIDRIDAGNGTYKELLDYERAALLTVRSGSDVEKQIKEQISKVTSQIKTNTVSAALAKADYEFNSGKITGKQYAAVITAQAQVYKTSDPAQYYKMLNSANEYTTKNPGKVGSGGGGGGGGGGRTAKQKTAESLDQHQAIRDKAKEYVAMYERGDREVLDDKGNNITLTPAFIHQQDMLILNSYDADIAALNAAGRHGDADKFIAAKIVSNNIARGHNTNNAAELDHHDLTAQYAQIPSLLGNQTVDLSKDAVQYPTGAEDPRLATQTIGNWVAHETTTINHLANNMVVDKTDERGTRYTTTGAKTGASSIDPAYIAARTDRAAVINELNSGRVLTDAEEQSLGARLIAAENIVNPLAGGKSYTFDTLPPVISGLFLAANTNSNNVAGLRDGTVKSVVNVLGQQQWLTAAPPGGIVAYGKDPNSRTFEYGKAGLTGDARTKLVDTIVDIKGVPTHVTAVAKLAESNLQMYVWTGKDKTLAGGVQVTSGMTLGPAQIAALKKSDSDWVNAEGVTRTSAVPYYQITVVPTDANGNKMAPQVWSQDPETNQWVKGEKLHLTPTMSGENGTVGIDQYGKPMIKWDTDSGTAVPYAGSNPNAAQGVLNTIMENPDLLTNGDEVLHNQGRGLDGNLRPDPSHDYTTAFKTSTGPRAADNWWEDGAKTREDAAQQRRVDQLRAANMDNMKNATKDDAFAAPTQGIADQFKVYGQSIGLNFGTPAQTPKPKTSPISGPNRNQITIPDTKVDLASGPSIGAKAPVITLPTFKPPTVRDQIGGVSAPLPTVPKINAATGFTVPKPTAPKPDSKYVNPMNATPKPTTTTTTYKRPIAS